MLQQKEITENVTSGTINMVRALCFRRESFKVRRQRIFAAPWRSTHRCTAVGQKQLHQQGTHPSDNGRKCIQGDSQQ